MRIKLYPVIISLFLLITPFNVLFGEGTKQLAPTEDDIVMLLIGQPNFGNFASYGAPATSRLFFTINDATEVVYLGLPQKHNGSGLPIAGNYNFRIRRASDNQIVHGPFVVSAADANAQSWNDVNLGPFPVTGEGYQISSDKYQFNPSEAGEYYIEFSSIDYLALWDISVVKDNQIQPGRVWSRNWAFRTPAENNEFPECVWDREFKGVLYSYTTDGFVSRVDFSDSGFQGLSFTLAFNQTGPKNTGNVENDRKSIENGNFTNNSAEHRIFLNEPDLNVFPEGNCGTVDVSESFHCDENGYCIPVTVTGPGLVEILLDFNQNGIYDEGSEDVILLYNFINGETSTCIPWDGLKGNGEEIQFGDVVNLLTSYQQGVQHWSVYDGEFMKRGFCVNVVRPICDPTIMTDVLHWDDRNIAADSGTGQAKDGRDGCSCGVDNCRTWTNFDSGVDNCNAVNDNLTSGYGDKNTLNTWWYANTVTSQQIGIPILTSQIELVANTVDGNVCLGDEFILQVNISGNTTILSIDWFGPEGLIISGDASNTQITITGGGTYSVLITDALGCTTEDALFVNEIACPVDIELDKTVDIMSPFVGDEVVFTIFLENKGPGPASGIRIEDVLPSGFYGIANIQPTSTIVGNIITWENISLGVNETLELSFTATVGFGNYTNTAEVIATNEPDVDSTPNNGVDTDGDGNCSDDNDDEDDGDCVTITPQPCSITGTISNLLCDDNGTPSMADDDTYTFDLTVNGQSTGTTWHTETGESGSYGNTLSFGPYLIATTPSVDIILTDDEADNCSTNLHINAPLTCSDECELMIETIAVLCHDNDTPTMEDDDYYTVDVIVTGYNVSNTWTASSGESGMYGEVITLGNFDITTGDISIDIFDSADGDCHQTLDIVAPSSCSGTCSISAEVFNVNCHDNGTPSMAFDDYYTVDVIVTGFNFSGSWLASSGEQGGYDEIITLGPFAIANGGVHIIITDVVETDCTTSIDVIAPETCSNECEITIETIEVLCNDNDTPAFPNDDYFTVEVVVTGYNLSNGWTANEGGAGNYGETVVLGGFSIEEGDIILSIFDNETNDCLITVEVSAPTTCSETCAINATIISTQCYDNGTPSMAFDDYYTLDVIVSGYNFNENWVANTGGSGIYDEITTLGPFDIAAGNVIIEIADETTTNCTTTIEAIAPETCSAECEIVIEVGEVICDDNGTPSYDNDDVFTVEVLVTGYNLGDTWVTNTGTVGNYGASTTLGTFDINNGEVTIEITDSETGDCTTTVTVQAPPRCSDVCWIENAEVMLVSCEDLGEEGNPYDDTFVYEMVVTGVNTATGGWVASDGTQGEYGVLTVSEPHLVSEGASMITITDIDNPSCTFDIEVFPVAPTVICPPDTDEGLVNRPIHLIEGNLTFSDAHYTPGDTLCWLPTAEEGIHYYDILQFEASPTIDSHQMYTFILYTDMNVTATSPSLPPAIIDGFGALFVGNYYTNDPCCNIQSTTQVPMEVNETLTGSPTIETTGLLDTTMHPVMRFTLPLLPGEMYSMVTTTWSSSAFGNYAWVVVGHGEELLYSPTTNEPFPTVETAVVYELTYFDMETILAETTPPPSYTGAPEIENECGLDSLYYFSELSLIDHCEDAFMNRSFIIRDINGNTDTCTQEIIFHRPLLSDILFPPLTVVLGCGDDYETDEFGNPIPAETGFPFILTTTGVEELPDGVSYNVSVTHKDLQEIIDSVLHSITRDWYVIDTCSADTIAKFSQLIKIGYEGIPTILCPVNNHPCAIDEDGTMLIPTNATDCWATAIIPLPEYEGGCAVWNFEVTTEIFRLDGLDSILIATILPGEDRTVAEMPLGDYVIHYIVEDEIQGETYEKYCAFRVVDLTNPVAICNDEQQLSLNGLGLGRLYINHINVGSYDNCELDSLMVRRLYTRNPLTCDSLDMPYYSPWGEYVDFNCCDAEQSIIIELRVVDVYGNDNTCWSNVWVEDKTLPYCYGLEDSTLTCIDLPNDFDFGDTIHLQSYFGLPLVYDNCTAYAIEYLPEIQLSDCGDGYIRRKFLAVDAVGNISADTFYQIITLLGERNYEIRFPKDTETDCLHSPDTLLINEWGCEQIEVVWEDEIFPAVGEECYRLMRTFRVTNWCEYDGFSPPFVISRDEDCDNFYGEEEVWLLVRENLAFIDRDSLEGNTIPAAGEVGACNELGNPEGYWQSLLSTGAWEYTQHLKVYDTIAPLIYFEIPDAFCTNNEACFAIINYPFSVEDACAIADLTMQIFFDENNDGTNDLDLTAENVIFGTYPDFTIQDTFPMGQHAIIVAVTDICGNMTTEILAFDVIDCYVPDPICQSGLIINLVAQAPNTDADGDGDIDDAAVTLDAGLLAACAEGDCSNPLRFSVNKIGHIADPSQTTIVLTCDDRYSLYLEVYVWDSAFNPYAVQPDGSLGGPNYKHCEVFVILQDSNHACFDCSTDLIVDGLITTHTGETIQNVIVTVENESMLPDVTNADGEYKLLGFDLGMSYSLRPNLDENPLNGVSTWDIITIQRHILGIAPFTNPYQLLAADVDHSGSITFTDIIELQSLLLGDIPTFSVVDSWLFVDAAYEFPEPLNPWATPFPQTIQIDEMTECLTDMDFIGIKMGDVDDSVIANEDDFVLLDERAAHPFIIQLEDQLLVKGEEYLLDFTAEDMRGIIGYQFALAIQSNDIEIIEIIGEETKKPNFARLFMPNSLAVSWFTPNLNTSSNTAKILFQIKYKSLVNNKLSKVFGKIKATVKAEAYDDLRHTRPIQIKFNTASEVQHYITLHQNKPNPFKEKTHIGFDLQEAAEVLFTITDIDGTVVKTMVNHYAKGYNEIIIEASSLGKSGVFYYKLNSSHETVVGKMIAIY